MMSKLTALNSDMRNSGKLDNDSIIQSAQLSLQDEVAEAVQLGTKSEMQKMMEQLNSLNEGMKAMDAQEESKREYIHPESVATPTILGTPAPLQADRAEDSKRMNQSSLTN